MGLRKRPETRHVVAKHHISEDVLDESNSDRESEYQHNRPVRVYGQLAHATDIPQSSQIIRRHLQKIPADRRSRSRSSETSDSGGSSYEYDEDQQDANSDYDEDEHFLSSKTKSALKNAAVGVLAAGASAYAIGKGEEMLHNYKSRMAQRSAKNPVMRQNTRDLHHSRVQWPQRHSSDLHQSQSRDFAIGSAVSLPPTMEAELRAGTAGLSLSNRHNRQTPAYIKITVPHRASPTLSDRHNRQTSASTQLMVPRRASPTLSRANTEPLQRHIVQARDESGNTFRNIIGSTSYRPSASDVGITATTDRVQISSRSTVSESGMMYIPSQTGLNLETRLKDVECGSKTKIKTDAFLDSGGVVDAISEEFFDELFKVGGADRLKVEAAIDLANPDGSIFRTRGQTMVTVQWLCPVSETHRELKKLKFQFQVIRGLYPHVVFIEHTIRDNDMRAAADTWPPEDRKEFLLFRLPRKSFEKRQQDGKEHERRRTANMQRAQLDAEERARLRGDNEKSRNSLELTNRSTSSRSRHYRR